MWMRLQMWMWVGGVAKDTVWMGGMDLDVAVVADAGVGGSKGFGN